MKDVIIIGGGPAGLTAAIYAARAGLSTTVFEGTVVGGQVAITAEVKNYPGFMDVSGYKLSQMMEEHSRSAGAEIIYANVDELEISPNGHSIKAAEILHEAKAVIAAMGTSRKKLGIPGEADFNGRGVSYCATCDGNFFKEREVAVIGGGNSALKDAAYLANICSKVYLVYRGHELTGSPSLAEKLQNNVEKIPLAAPTAISGKGFVDGVSIRNVNSGVTLNLPIAGVFISIGTVAQSALLEGILQLDESGRVLSGEDCTTSVPGLFVAGDLRKKYLYQIATAAADGAVAASAAGRFVRKNEKVR